MTQTFEHPHAQMREGSPLAFVPVFAEQMRGRGYAAASMKTCVGLVNDFAAWLDRREIEVSRLSTGLAMEYLAERYLDRRRRRGDTFTLRSFVELCMADRREAQGEPPVATTPVQRARQRFERYLRSERGLAEASVRLYAAAVGRFLEHVFADREVRLGELTAVDVVTFVQTEAARLNHAKRAKVVTTALRSFLQYGRYRGEIGADLHDCVPAVANWSMAGVPRAISASQVKRLLGACDRRSPGGRRDYAMLLLLARLGLRAGEVVELKLEDVDWHEGVVRVRGPAHRCDQLPLPADVGDALAQYLREGRPPCSARNVFVRSRAPRQAFRSASAVSCVVCRALRRAGIESPVKGAHLLRHSLATQMLGQGASLAEIGQILRHRNPQTTTIYAKVDLDSLRMLALPWPGGAQ